MAEEGGKDLKNGNLVRPCVKTKTTNIFNGLER